MSSSTVVSLAILKVNWDRSGRDYIENYVPFVAECIRLSSDEVVSLPNVQTSLMEIFGLELPQNLIRSMLLRVKKRKYITLKNKVYYPNRKKLSELGFKELRDQVLEQHEKVIEGLINFADERYSLSWSFEDAQDALLQFLVDNELFVMHVDTRSSVIPSLSYPKKSNKYVVASFVRHLQESKSSFLTYLGNIAKGNMLANVLFLPDPHEPHRKFRKTAIYFDTPFLINALGYAGETRQLPCLELIDLLYETGADLRCFDHTLREISGALDACGAQLTRGRGKYTYGPGIPTFEYFLSKGYTTSDVELLVGRLERDLRSLRILVVSKPEYIEEHVIDEAELLEHLKSTLKYWREKAAERDVDSISAIYRLRQSRDYRFIEESRGIFVTSNTTLVKAVASYYYRQAQPTSIAPCLSDYALTNLIWLKRPTAAPDLPLKRIIADCFAATQPAEDLWNTYLREIDKLEEMGDISPDDYYHLRYSMEAKTSLMDLTLGEEQAFTTGTVPEILESVKRQIREDLVSKLDVTEAKVRSLEVLNDQRSQNIRSRAERGSRKITDLVKVIALIIIIGIAIITSPWVNLVPDITAGNIILWIAWLLFSFVSILDLWKGTTIGSLFRRLEIFVTKKIEALLAKITS